MADHIRSTGSLDALSLKEEADHPQVSALALAQRRHEPLELGVGLDREESFIVVIGNFDAQLLAPSASVPVSAATAMAGASPLTGCSTSIHAYRK